MLGLHMIIHSLMAGLAVFLIAGLFMPPPPGLSFVFFFLTSAILVVHLITFAIELTTTHATDDAHAVVKMITRWRFSYQFWLGMVLVGNLLPLLFLITGQGGSATIAGVLILVGLYFAERIWVRAPQMIPLS